MKRGYVVDSYRQLIGRLRARVRPFVLRRLKRDVAPELPPRTEVVLHVELATDERQVYDAIRVATREDVAARFAVGGSALQVLEALLRLRQAACDASLVPGAQTLRSSKLEVLRESLEESVAEGHKALVFSQWTSLLDRVEPVLRDADLPFVRLDGATRDRAAVVAQFQSESGPPVMIVSLRAGGTGLNLTAADSVFILDPWWNPAVEEQAADRAHRIGQTRPVMIYRRHRHRRGTRARAPGDQARTRRDGAQRRRGARDHARRAARAAELKNHPISRGSTRSIAGKLHIGAALHEIACTDGEFLVQCVPGWLHQLGRLVWPFIVSALAV